MITSGFSKNGAQWAFNKQTIKLQLIEAMAHIVGPIIPQRSTDFGVA
jgi:hypothetical protein